VVAAAVTFVLHVVVNARDGIFRDELYYLACADHPAWGYVDHPPFSIAVLRAWRAVAGDSVTAIRMVPALLGVVLVLLGARLAAVLGGGRPAQSLAALAVAVVPQYLSITGYYAMNAFDLVCWSLLALLVARLLETDDARLWWIFGLVAGLGLLNKMSPLFFCAGLAAAVPFTPLRRHLRSPHLWGGAALAALLVAPHVFWQVRNGWPTAEFIANATRYKNAPISVAQFLGAQLLEILPLNAPLWIAGLVVLLAGPLRRFRALGIVYVVACAILALQGGKPYYLGPAYPMLLAAGAVMVERWTTSRPVLLRAAAVVLAVGGILAAPLALPVLSPEGYVAYSRAAGLQPRAQERHALGSLPQFFADRHGWREMTALVAEAYHSLPEHEKARTLIVADNYGEAGAIDYFGKALGLPRASSGHNSYFMWGPTIADPAVVITVNISPEDLAGVCQQVETRGKLTHPWAMPFEQRFPVAICRGFKVPLEQAWAAGRSYI
jgi:hypothetical protein